MGKTVTAADTKLSALELCVLVAIIAAQLLTVLFFRYPPSIDGASHLATSEILVDLMRGDPFYTEHFRVDYSPVPYWTVHFITTPLTAVFGAVWAYAISLALYVIALPLSFLFLIRTVAPESTPLTAIVALGCFNSWYWLGVGNFRFGWIFFLIALALFLGLDRYGRWAGLGFVACVVGSYFSHVMALAPLCGVIGLLCILDFLEKRSRLNFELRLRATHYALATVPVLAMLVAVYYTLIRPGPDESMAGFLWNMHWIRLVAIFANPFRSPTLVHWSPYVLLLFTVLIAWLAPFRHRILSHPLQTAIRATHPALLTCFFVVTAVYYFLPEYTLDLDGKQVEDLSSRFGPFAFFLAFASIKLRISPKARRVIVLGTVLFALVKIPDSWMLHHMQNDVITRLQTQVLPHLPRHSHVLPICSIEARDDIGRYQREWMLVDYAVLDREIYSPAIYAVAGQQPLSHRSRDRYLEPENYRPTESDWQKYDFILIQSPRDERASRGWEDRTELVASTPGFWLYRVVEDDP